MNSRFSWSGLAVAFFAGAVAADVPRLIHYQGKLRASSGDLVNGTVSLRFQLYDHITYTSPTGLDETHSTVGVANGLFNVLIGSETPGGIPDAALDAPTVFLGISIDGGQELAPRTRVASSSHALKSRSAEQLVEPDTFTPAVNVLAGGRVGIGTPTPDMSALLELASTTQGFLMPRLSQTQRDELSSPPDGLMIFNTTTQCFNSRMGGRWRQACFDCDFPEPAAASNSPVCSGQSLRLTVTDVSGATYSWNGPNGFTSTDREPVIPNADSAHAGLYIVIATLDGCNSRPAFTAVEVQPGPSSEFTPTTGISEYPVVFTPGTLGADSYAWTFQGGTPNSSTDEHPEITWGAPGVYDVTLAVSIGGCTAESMTQVNIFYPRSCLAIKTASPSAADGVYSIDPDGDGGNAPQSVICDMSTDGGGWTLIVARGQANGLGTFPMESSLPITWNGYNADSVVVGQWMSMVGSTFSILSRSTHSPTEYIHDDVTNWGGIIPWLNCCGFPIGSCKDFLDLGDITYRGDSSVQHVYFGNNFASDCTNYSFQYRGFGLSDDVGLPNGHIHYSPSYAFGLYGGENTNNQTQMISRAGQMAVYGQGDLFFFIR